MRGDDETPPTRTVVTEGGAFESVYLFLALVARGRLQHLELFEIDALDAALARFDARRPDPLRLPPTAPTRRRDR